MLACLAATRPRRGRREDGREASAGASPLARPFPRPPALGSDGAAALAPAARRARGRGPSRVVCAPRARASRLTPCSGRWASRPSRACRTAAGAPPPAPRPAAGSSRVTLARPLRPRGVRAASLRPSACATRRRARAGFLTARAARPSAAWTTACPRLPTWWRPVSELQFLNCSFIAENQPPPRGTGVRGCAAWQNWPAPPSRRPSRWGAASQGASARGRPGPLATPAPGPEVATGHGRTRGRLSGPSGHRVPLSPPLARASAPPRARASWARNTPPCQPRARPAAWRARPARALEARLRWHRSTLNRCDCGIHATGASPPPHCHASSLLWGGARLYCARRLVISRKYSEIKLLENALHFS